MRSRLRKTRRTQRARSGVKTRQMTAEDAGEGSGEAKAAVQVAQPPIGEAQKNPLCDELLAADGMSGPQPATLERCAPGSVVRWRIVLGHLLLSVAQGRSQLRVLTCSCAVQVVSDNCPPASSALPCQVDALRRPLIFPSLAFASPNWDCLVRV